MRETGEIINISENTIKINREKFYDNLKLSLKYNGQDDEYGIYANGITYFKNTVLEVFEHLNKKICVNLDNKSFSKMEDFLEWLYLESNLQLGIEKHKKFIDKAYNTIKERGVY